MNESRGRRRRNDVLKLDREKIEKKLMDDKIR